MTDRRKKPIPWGGRIWPSRAALARHLAASLGVTVRHAQNAIAQGRVDTLGIGPGEMSERRQERAAARLRHVWEGVRG